jgi:hypothetical protein
LNFGTSKKQILSPKNQIRNAFTARSNHGGELKKFAGKKSSIGIKKTQYFVDSQMKKSRSPDLLRQKKKIDTGSKLKKKINLRDRKRRKTKTCTEGQLQRIKLHADGLLRNKLKQSGVNRSKVMNYQVSKKSHKNPNSKKGRRKIVSNNNSISRKEFDKNKRNIEIEKVSNKSNLRHFDLSIPMPQEQEGIDLDSEEYQPFRNPNISARNSKQMSRKNSQTRNNKKKKKQYRKDLDQNYQGSPLRKLEQTGFTVGSNYASITSKNIKNGNLKKKKN